MSNNKKKYPGIKMTMLGDLARLTQDSSASGYGASFSSPSHDSDSDD